MKTNAVLVPTIVMRMQHALTAWAASRARAMLDGQEMEFRVLPLLNAVQVLFMIVLVMPHVSKRLDHSLAPAIMAMLAMVWCAMM
jgi:hypothetical protein